jgi:hypothetical protein
LPVGYEAKHEHRGGKLMRRWLVKRPEDEWILDLIWRMAEAGKSAPAMGLELGRRGAMTRPRRKGGARKGGAPIVYQPRPWTANRVSQVLCCPFYAGLQSYKGETFPGDWATSRTRP